MLLNQKQIKQIRFIIKQSFKQRYPQIKSSYITEALASALGYKSNASFIAMDYKVKKYNRHDFYYKLNELSGLDISEPDGYDIIDFAYFSVSKDYENVPLKYLTTQEIIEPFINIYKRINPISENSEMWRDRMFVMVESSLGLFRYLKIDFNIVDLNSLLSLEKLIYFYNESISDKDNKDGDAEEVKVFKSYIKSIPFLDKVMLMPLSNKDKELYKLGYRQHWYLKMMIDVIFVEISHLLGKVIFDNHIVPKNI